MNFNFVVLVGTSKELVLQEKLRMSKRLNSEREMNHSCPFVLYEIRMLVPQLCLTASDLD